VRIDLDCAKGCKQARGWVCVVKDDDRPCALGVLLATKPIVAADSQVEAFQVA
jgi:hypothetical protein